LLPAVVLPYLETWIGSLFAADELASCRCSHWCLGVLYTHELLSLSARPNRADCDALRDSFIKAFAALLLLSGVGAWWMVLTQQSRKVAQEESNRQTQLLMQEIESHQRTDEQLQKAKQLAEQANQAKSRYITAISHELRTPLNSILGYAQILDADENIPPQAQTGGQRDPAQR
jgi:signal transduction histidine kinase